MLAVRAAGAIELRTTSGRKTIVRTAVAESEAEPPAAEEQLPVPRVVEPSVEFVDDGFYGDACYPGACLPGCLTDRVWTDVEFLLWWRKGRYFPPLVTTGAAGILPQATTLFGGQRVDESPRPAGGWKSACGWTAAGSWEWVGIWWPWATRRWNSRSHRLILR